VEVERLIARFQREASPEVQQRVNEQIQRIQETAQQNATAYTQRVATFLLNSVLRIFQTLTFLLGFLIIPFFLFYILLDSNRLPRALNRMLHPRIKDDFWNLLRIVDTIFGKYIRGQLTLGLVVGVMSFVGLQGLNLAGYEVRFTVLLALVAAVGELIPVVGPILSAIPAIIVGATDGAGTALAVTVLYIVIQQVENQVLVPRIVGNTLRLHAAILMALLVIASQVGGLLFVILVAPLTAIARDVFIYLHQRLEDPPVPPEPAINHVLAPDASGEG
jgi:predicted PurR-regulated permease PerM